MAPPSLTVFYLFSITVYPQPTNSLRAEIVILSVLSASGTVPGVKKILNKHVELMDDWLLCPSQYVVVYGGGEFIQSYPKVCVILSTIIIPILQIRK